MRDTFKIRKDSEVDPKSTVSPQLPAYTTIWANSDTCTTVVNVRATRATTPGKLDERLQQQICFYEKKYTKIIEVNYFSTYTDSCSLCSRNESFHLQAVLI